MGESPCGTPWHVLRVCHVGKTGHGIILGYVHLALLALYFLHFPLLSIATSACDGPLECNKSRFHQWYLSAEEVEVRHHTPSTSEGNTTLLFSRASHASQTQRGGSTVAELVAPRSSISLLLREANCIGVSASPRVLTTRSNCSTTAKAVAKYSQHIAKRSLE